MSGQYNFRHSDIEHIKNEIASRLKIKAGKIVFDGKKIIITMKGEKGGTGNTGSAPKHEWVGLEVRFENPDGTWGPWVCLRGDKGDPGESIKGDKGDPGESIKGDPGESIKGDKGESIKGDKGDPGEKGDPGASIKGDKGDPGDKSDPGDKGDPGKSIKGDKGDPGEPGKTPQKGIDYRDGEDAKIPESVTIAVLTDVELVDGKLSKKFQHVKIYIGE